VIDVPGLARFEIAPHHCFACGTLNSTGMGLVLHVEPGRSWVEHTLEPRFQGWDGIAHGGILATILDEVMAWALVGEDNWGLTARLSIDFKRPVKVGQAILAEGRITRSRRRIVDTAGQVTDAATGEVLATATGVYVAADEERKRALRQQYGWRSLASTAADTPAPVDNGS
jgi:acyl-coenzyme A thioesterase PaaI-like protein